MTGVKKAKIGLAIVLCIVVFVLVIQNRQAVTINVLFWNLHISLVLLIPFVFLIGMVVGYVARRR